MDTTMQLMTAAGLAIALAFGATSCGDDDQADTIPLSEWLDEFEQVCVDVQSELTPGLTDEEFTAVTERYAAKIRAVPLPDEMADTATELIDLMVESNTSNDLDDAAIEALDEQAFAALTALGVSGPCVEGIPG